MTANNHVSQVSDLCGRPIDGVCFFADYVQFDFVGPILRLMALPVLVSKELQQIAVFPGVGSGDAFRDMIGQTVSRVDRLHDRIVIITEEGTSVEARIDATSGDESVHFVPWANGHLLVAEMEVW